MHDVKLPGGVTLPALGMGTWRMGESGATKAGDTAAVRQAVEVGYRLFDTAEMYGEGGAESMLGQALGEAMRAGDVRRDELVIVSKVYPHNAGRESAVAACERSLRRLGLDQLDLYLLHWPGSIPLAQTVEAFERLRDAGRLREWGVSNFDTDDMQALWAVDGGARCAANQIWYSVSQRGAEFDLLPWMRERGLPLMAYSPIDQAALAADRTLAAIGRCVQASAAQVALAWAMRAGDVIAIPKAVKVDHQRDNLASTRLTLDAEAISAIDRSFPAPGRKRSLAIN